MKNITEILSQIEFFNIGPFKFYTYGIIIGISVIILIVNFFKRLPLKISNNNSLYISIAIISLFSIFCARAFFVLQNWSYYSSNLTEIIDLTKGGYTIFGILAGGLIGYFISWNIILRNNHKDLNAFDLPDNLFLFLPLSQAIGRVANFVNQELYGPPTDLPWGIYIQPDKREQGYEQYEYFHPAFLYESILNILSFVILNTIDNKIIKGRNKHKGLITGLYFVNYGIIRMITERFRIDNQPIFLEMIKTQDIYCLLMILLGLGIIFINRSQGKVSHESQKFDNNR
ncbi:prolipoprotein diacylglyceryl transferase [Candidatus Dojkabacteria bacterium]|nr:prolipoprotein diacylglyceryl transferase [Candidatus Dojkabacteria bacterium]